MLGAVCPQNTILLFVPILCSHFYFSNHQNFLAQLGNGKSMLFNAFVLPLVARHVHMFSSHKYLFHTL